MEELPSRLCQYGIAAQNNRNGVAHAIAEESLYAELDPKTHYWTGDVFTRMLGKILVNVRNEITKGMYHFMETSIPRSC